MSTLFKKAARHSIKLKIGIDGPSGSGKTMGALALAHGITQGGRIAVVDSENGSASLYADRYEFDTVQIANADPKTYMDMIDAAVDGKYDVVVIDSLTHAWQAVLNAKDDHDRDNPKSNSFANWRLFAPRWEGLMQHILQAPIHVIATMRSKQAYEQVDRNGKKAVVKLGLQPQVRDGAEYEFGIMFSVNQAHKAEATKDRTALFTDQFLDLCDSEVHASLVGWMNSGGPIASTLVPDKASLDQIGRLNALLVHDVVTSEARAKVGRAIARGLTHEKAEAFIAQIVAQIAAQSADAEVGRMKAAVAADGAELPWVENNEQLG